MASSAHTKIAMYLLLLALFISLPARATSIVVLYGPDAVFIASDSKVASVDGKISWPGCKIHITKNYVWASSGFSFELNGPFDIEKLVPESLGDGEPSAASLNILESRLKASFNSLLPKLTAIRFRP